MFKDALWPQPPFLLFRNPKHILFAMVQEILEIKATKGNIILGNIVRLDMNNSRTYQRNDFSHKHSNNGRKRPQSKKLYDSKQPEGLPRYSEKSVNHVENGCSTAAVSLHEMPSRSTSGANEMPRGGPKNAQPMKLYDSKPPEGLRQYSWKSVDHVEHGCSTAAVSSHEMPSRSTSGVDEMPRGGPENAQPIP